MLIIELFFFLLGGLVGMVGVWVYVFIYFEGASCS